MKRLAVLGDSITKGTYTAPTDPSPNSIASPNFADLVCRALGYAHRSSGSRDTLGFA